VPFPDESHTASVVSYRPSWPSEFLVVAGPLRSALGDAAVDHVGSTSVPGLAAKDCIDVQVRVLSLESVSPLFSRLGYRRRPEPWNQSDGPGLPKLVFAPPPGARAVNVHVRLRGGPNARFPLLFRDFLRADSEARDSWGAFKQRLSRAVPELLAYGQIKAPATAILMSAAERWASATGWVTPD
jgi:GrpB-like predicted nucleotidyltransferase (UPF0157 family)